jgi:hypothetical protein
LIQSINIIALRFDLRLDYILVDPSNFSRMQTTLLSYLRIFLMTTHMELYFSHVVIRQSLELFDTAIIPGLYYFWWKSRLRFVLVYGGQETLSYLSRRKPVYNSLSVFNIPLVLQAPTTLGVS